MLIIAFAPKTSKIIPRIFCRHFRHCAVITKNEKEFILYQFVCRHNIQKISLKMRDIKILAGHGWRFIYLPHDINYRFEPMRAWTCVGMAKNAIGINAPTILTPNQLFRKLSIQ